MQNPYIPMHSHFRFLERLKIKKCVNNKLEVRTLCKFCSASSTSAADLAKPYLCQKPTTLLRKI